MGFRPTSRNVFLKNWAFYMSLILLVQVFSKNFESIRLTVLHTKISSKVLIRYKTGVVFCINKNQHILALLLDKSMGW